MFRSQALQLEESWPRGAGGGLLAATQTPPGSRGLGSAAVTAKVSSPSRAWVSQALKPLGLHCYSHCIVDISQG